MIRQAFSKEDYDRIYLEQLHWREREERLRQEARQRNESFVGYDGRCDDEPTEEWEVREYRLVRWVLIVFAGICAVAGLWLGAK